jgi:hypothetical protein
LPADRIAALDELGMIWEPHVQDWLDGLADLREFAARHGHANPPRDFRGPRIKALRAWLNRRTTEWRRGQLPPDRIAALHDLGVRLK